MAKTPSNDDRAVNAFLLNYDRAALARSLYDSQLHRFTNDLISRIEIDAGLLSESFATYRVVYHEFNSEDLERVAGSLISAGAVTSINNELAKIAPHWDPLSVGKVKREASLGSDLVFGFQML